MLDAPTTGAVSSEPPLRTLQRNGTRAGLSGLSSLLRARRPGRCHVGSVFQAEAKEVGASRDVSPLLVGLRACSRYGFGPQTGENGADTGDGDNRDDGDGGSHAHQPWSGEGSS